MLPLSATRAVMGRVRVHSPDPDRLRTRQRLTRALEGVEWSPPGLPPQAILILRRLAPPAPAPDRRSSFARRTAAEVARCARLARRPRLHADAIAADAVLFADEAELVACLLHDWLRGVVADRWWWRSVLGSSGADHWLRQHVLTRGDVLVPALSLLEPQRDVVRWTSRLTLADTRVAAAAVAHAFALRDIPLSGSPAAPRAPSGDRPGAESITGGAASTQTARASVQLAALVPELRAAALDPERQRLLILVCVAMRAPAWGRSADFAVALRVVDRIESPPAWTAGSPLSGAVTIDPPPQAPPTVPIEVPSDVPDPSPRMAATEDVRSTVVPLAPELPVRPARARTPGAQPSAPPAALPLSETGTLTDTPATGRWSPARAQNPESRTATAVDLLSNGAVPTTVTSPSPPSRDAEPPASLATCTTTHYGGMFYLLNAWLAMGLYSDFTAPRGKNLDISPWDLLALTGRAWFGEPFELDPLWSTLGELAVRDPTVPPGGELTHSDGWLERQLETLHARLRRALGAEAAEDVTALVCCHRADVEITPACVRVHLSLCDLPLAIRIAGLDRDPGWIPAAGRGVSFHFA